MTDFYRSKKWQKLRLAALRRDGGLCREAKRYGKIVEADTVHHAWPVELYPQYATCLWNLVSLSREAHNAMHDRQTGELTPLGEYWRRKCTPPPV